MVDEYDGQDVSDVFGYLKLSERVLTSACDESIHMGPLQQRSDGADGAVE